MKPVAYRSRDAQIGRWAAADNADRDELPFHIFPTPLCGWIDKRAEALADGSTCTRPFDPFDHQIAGAEANSVYIRPCHSCQNVSLRSRCRGDKKGVYF